MAIRHGKSGVPGYIYPVDATHCLLCRSTMAPIHIPQVQTAALVSKIGGELEFRDDYPVPEPGQNEVLAKVLYTGVCQSGWLLLTLFLGW